MAALPANVGGIGPASPFERNQITLRRSLHRHDDARVLEQLAIECPDLGAVTASSVAVTGQFRHFHQLYYGTVRPLTTLTA